MSREGAAGHRRRRLFFALLPGGGLTGACTREELRAIVPNAEVVAVKEGLGRYTCLSMSAQAARDAIRDAASRAMKKLAEIRPYKIDGPVTIQVEYTTGNSLPIDAGLTPGSEVMDDRTIRYRGKDFWEAWTRARARF